MRQILSLSFLMLLMFSCKKKEPEFNEPMNVSVYEDLSYDGNQVVLYFETDRSLTCGSSIIQGNASVAGSDVTVTITGVSTPPQCKYSPSKINRFFGLGKLADGVYNLTVKNGNHTSNGTLMVEDKRLSISFSRLANLAVAGNEMMRVPVGAIWGNVMYASPTQAAMADSFKAKLETNGATVLSLPDGEYHYFTIRSGTLTVAYNGVNLYLNRKDFLYSYPGVTDSLQKVASGYSFLNPQANFYIRTWDGRNFNIPGPPISAL